MASLLWLSGRIIKGTDPGVRLTVASLASWFTLPHADLAYLFDPCCAHFLIRGMCVESFTWERSEDPLTHCLLAKAWNESGWPSGYLQTQVRIPEETREVPLEQNGDLSHQMRVQTREG